MLGRARQVCPIGWGVTLFRAVAGVAKLGDAARSAFLARRHPHVSRTPKPLAGQPQPVGDLVARFLARSGLAAKVEAASVLTDWPERVGPQIAAVTEPRGLSDDTLYVAVASSAWMMELNLMKAELMKRINAGKREGKIRQIVFVMAA